ncbi:FAD-dependent oxidoreductase [Vibrio natriegens]|jgi:NADPH-dependent 2,4-dienoyl-CoA reductase/sulfur reductase-like enzyme/rhodanese-related sulfurtransferase|uniref:CoA-disulfide reductase n=1 Tax=Vibrio natriegens NBRC 15636 = ATCC 14048 = DSM 759 TaxID=1219067 RepID=A0AAN0Y5P8_VIBNA|nr:FAD-dependent oxidoreductase [Vibrio natriegens]ALR18296.1 CoA-disulfide reductase [Vibrio natriegens NBRC 15636 = ATCC 14048 = DSM 759]ANQ14244.1 CoA-disulfide reductase [Vibrio natriegens NBRC 15636 = ATCC 14048 = DSM 759]ANQ24183.1 CoA-disulfide reductase [Vibrio natriegens]EPM40281.1 CoA-disulfide reductase [Vibrio natriegens NBRC 15636 = ATCC 14048 = DSM 759]MCG9700772.1 FAD-dependent oxidoreductase [Vibrio natriegens]
MTKILIVGGVAGGASAAARARRLSEDAEIIMFERGPFVSFANCGLPYHIGGDIQERSKLLLQTPESFLARFNVDVRVMNEVVSVNRQDKTIVVKNLIDGSEYEESYDFLLLSPGAGPIVPPIPGLDNHLTHSLRNIPDMDRIIETIQMNKPEHATVVGGGFIGLEMMEAFHQLGIKTSLIEMADQVMTPVDREMAGFAHAEIRDKGIDLKLGVALESVQFVPNEHVASFDSGESEKHQHLEGELELTLNNGEKLTTDILIMAIGVRPETKLAQEAGLEIGALGGISTNEYMQTSDPSIYAVGDAVEEKDFVTGEPTLVPLAGPANRQGRMAADNMLGRSETYQGTQGTAICKIFDLAVASTGKNEKQLKRAGIDYDKVYVHTASHASYYPGAEVVSFKMLFDPKSGKILGAQAVGKDGIDKRIDVMAVAQRAGMTVEQLQHLELTYAPPYGSAKDVINQAAFVANNIIKGDATAIHYDEMDSLTDDQVLLDVRNPGELESVGFIKDAINIPVDQLRHRMDELPKDKEIVIYCQVGLRGNVAYRQLVNNGFKARNLIGGYRTYKFAKA